MIPQVTTRSVATVFGGAGFLGRYIVKRLAQHGYIVRVAGRDPEAALFLKPMGGVGQVVPLYANITNDATVHRAVEGAGLVVNLVGILAEGKAGEFERVHVEGAGRIARLSAAAGVSHLVHVSSIGASADSPSQYAQSKARGEQAVHAAFAGATVLRPSLVFGPEDQFFNRFAAMAQFLPFMPVIAGNTRMQPVYVGDVADAAMAVLRLADAAGATYELGGPEVLTFREILAYVLKETQRNHRLLEIPMGLARLQAAVMELLPGKPLTRDQLLMLSSDNVVTPGAKGLPELGIIPTPIDLIVPTYLRRFRPGGGKRLTILDEAETAGPGLSA